MKIIDILGTHTEGVAFEFFPPRTEAGKNTFAATAKALKAHKPLYVSMTCGAAGSRQGYTQEAVDVLLGQNYSTVMPHLTCVDATSGGIADVLESYKKKGIENIMALRGDPPQDNNDFDFSRQEFRCAYDLVKTVKRYNHFCIGVAVYPEGHIQSRSFEEDLEYTKQKIDAGADFAVTQMFFDNAYYYNFLEQAKRKGIAIPIIAGILPLVDIVKVKQFISICRTTIPRQIEVEMMRFSGRPEDMEKVGLDFTIAQCRDLIKNGFGKLHFFTLNKPEVIARIVSAL
ncbi:MAG: methylenetetrahydrofolate reductase [NAD(P)H] [Candidatus Omnitrophota bacterium]